MHQKFLHLQLINSRTCSEHKNGWNQISPKNQSFKNLIHMSNISLLSAGVYEVPKNTSKINKQNGT